MARERGPILKRCRRLELEPQVVGINKKSKRQSMQTTRKLSQYGMQLREKQKAKFVYGLQEKQFKLLSSTVQKKCPVLQLKTCFSFWSFALTMLSIAWALQPQDVKLVS